MENTEGEVQLNDFRLAKLLNQNIVGWTRSPKDFFKKRAYANKIRVFWTCFFTGGFLRRVLKPPQEGTEYLR